MTDDNLFLRLQSGDEDSLSIIYERYRNEFIDWAIKRHNCTVEDAKDIFQNIVVIFFMKIKGEKMKTLNSSIKTYLFGIGKNLLKQRKEEHLSLDRCISVELEYVTEKDARKIDAITNGLSKMNPLCREILTDFYFKGAMMEDIALAYDYKNIQSAKTQKYKCLQKLKDLLTNK